jgi:hypothetical protein
MQRYTLKGGRLDPEVVVADRTALKGAIAWSRDVKISFLRVVSAKVSIPGKPQSVHPPPQSLAFLGISGQKFPDVSFGTRRRSGSP